MTVETWLQNAIADAERRGLPQLKPLLEMLAKTVAAVRTGDFNVSAASDRQPNRESR